MLKNLNLDPDPAANPPAGGISTEQHNALVEKARSEEKAKVFNRISALEADVARLNGEVTETKKLLAAAEQATAAAVSALDAIKNSRTASGEVDLKVLTAQIAETLRKDLGKVAQKQIEATEERVAALEEENNKLRYEQNKALAIKEAGGLDAVIEQTITGTTIEELRKSALESAQLRTSIAGGNSRTGTQNNQNDNTQSSGVQPPPVLQAGGGLSGTGRLPADSAAGTVLNGVKTMSTEDYAKNRAQIKSEVINRHMARPRAMNNR